MTEPYLAARQRYQEALNSLDAANREMQTAQGGDADAAYAAILKLADAVRTLRESLEAVKATEGSQ